MAIRVGVVFSVFDKPVSVLVRDDLPLAGLIDCAEVRAGRSEIEAAHFLPAGESKMWKWRIIPALETGATAVQWAAHRGATTVFRKHDGAGDPLREDFFSDQDDFTSSGSENGENPPAQVDFAADVLKNQEQAPSGGAQRIRADEQESAAGGSEIYPKQIKSGASHALFDSASGKGDDEQVRKIEFTLSYCEMEMELKLKAGMRRMPAENVVKLQEMGKIKVLIAREFEVNEDSLQHRLVPVPDHGMMIDEWARMSGTVVFSEAKSDEESDVEELDEESDEESDVEESSDEESDEGIGR